MALRAAIGFQQHQRLRVKDVNLLGGGIEQASEPTGQVFAELPLGDIADDDHESRRLIEIQGLDPEFHRERRRVTPPADDPGQGYLAAISTCEVVRESHTRRIEEWHRDRQSTRLNSSHYSASRMPSSA